MCVFDNFRSCVTVTLDQLAKQDESDEKADGALDVGQQESMLKDGSDYDFFRARFDALTAEKSRLLKDVHLQAAWGPRRATRHAARKSS